MNKLKYPIGFFSFDPTLASDRTDQWIDDLVTFPKRLRELVTPFTEEQLDTPYRRNGWTVRQLIHHVADSHVNALMRFKLALTEDNPHIKPYHQDSWAALPDYRLPIEVSLMLIESIHMRWTEVLKSLNPGQFERVFQHPESGACSVYKHTALYAWHSNHHLAHIQTLKERNRW